MTYFTALKVRPFALLWTGQTISCVGDHLYQVALAWWVLKHTGSVTVMGTVLLCSMIPMLLCALPAGAYVDRLPRATLMITSDLARGIIATIVAVLAATQQLDVWHVYLASVLFGLVDAFFQPAYTALVPTLTPPEALPSANAITSLSVQAGRFLGPVFGATLIATGGTPAAFAIDAASFFISAAFLLPLWRRSPAQTPTEAPPDVIGSVREGMAVVFGAPWLWITLGVSALANMALAGPYQVALPFLVEQHFGADVHVLGLLYAAFPIGYVLSGVWLGRYTQIRRRGYLMYGALAVSGLGMLALGLPIGIVGVLVAAVLNGAALEASSLIWTNVLQELVPNDQLGRVASIDVLLTYGLLPVGFVLTSWATGYLGAALVCLLGGALAAGVALLGLTHPAIRRMV
jgi:MFS family permease